jgi:hypothetical protein
MRRPTQIEKKEKKKNFYMYFFLKGEKKLIFYFKRFKKIKLFLNKKIVTLNFIT